MALIPLFWGCAPGERVRISGGETRVDPPATAASGSAPSRASESNPPATPARPVAVAVLEPRALAALERSGFSFGRLAFASPAEDARSLARKTAFGSVVRVLAADVHEVKRRHPLAKVTSMDGFRLFDARLLESDETRFELIGVFNRLDRTPLYPGTCGEVRFVYRLRYDTRQGGAPMSGRLPLTLNLVFLANGRGGCADAARSWRVPEGASDEDAALFLATEGALAPERRRGFTLKSLETNLQTFRLQSSVHVSMAGHIDYVLRVFHPLDAARSAFAPAAMENMPDVARLGKDTALRAELLAHLKQPDTLRAVDLGLLNLPERFLAKQATSVSPRGLTRRQNRPFSQLFRAEDFALAELAGLESVRTPAELLRRLDGASCTGCHQSHSIAGFHHVGRDQAATPAYNALVDGSSEHLRADLERRRGYVTRVAEGVPPDELRPIPERQGLAGGHGAPCGLPGKGLDDWRCDPGLVCEALEDPEIGACLAAGELGAPCEVGTMVAGTAPHRDQIARLQDRACHERQYCYENLSGFPQGACVAACSDRVPGGACADFLDVDAFQNCLRAKRPVGECEKKHVVAVSLRACDTEHPCRQDYVCARARDGAGACIPPYFVYQLRLDGYPFPR